MGLFCVNMHFRATDDKILSAAVKRRGISDYLVLPAKNGWTSLYEAEASNQDDQRIRDLTAGLSQDLGDVAIAFLCHDSDIACYWLFEDGQLIDEFNSSPDYFDPHATSSGPHSGGRPDVLLRFCAPAFVATISTRFWATSQCSPRVSSSGWPMRWQSTKKGGSPTTATRPTARGQTALAGSAAMTTMMAATMTGPAACRISWQSARAWRPRGPDARRRFGRHVGRPAGRSLDRGGRAGDTDEIDRLLADGVEIDAESPTPLPTAGPVSGMAQFFAGGVPKVPMTPLLAAVANKQRPQPSICWTAARTRITPIRSSERRCMRRPERGNGIARAAHRSRGQRECPQRARSNAVTGRRDRPRDRGSTRPRSQDDGVDGGRRSPDSPINCRRSRYPPKAGKSANNSSSPGCRAKIPLPLGEGRERVSVSDRDRVI